MKYTEIDPTQRTRHSRLKLRNCHVLYTFNFISFYSRVDVGLFVFNFIYIFCVLHHLFGMSSCWVLQQWLWLLLAVILLLQCMPVYSQQH